VYRAQSRRANHQLTTKIHALCDAQGRPTALVLTKGNASDLCGFDALVSCVRSKTLIGDKGYDADARVRQVLSSLGTEAVIPPRCNRKTPASYDQQLYKQRHKIENFFSRLKEYRGIATRFEKTANNFMAGVYLAAAMTWLN
jgi:transposase